MYFTEFERIRISHPIHLWQPFYCHRCWNAQFLGSGVFFWLFCNTKTRRVREAVSFAGQAVAVCKHWRLCTTDERTTWPVTWLPMLLEGGEPWLRTTSSTYHQLRLDVDRFPIDGRSISITPLFESKASLLTARSTNTNLSNIRAACNPLIIFQHFLPSQSGWISCEMMLLFVSCH